MRGVQQLSDLLVAVEDDAVIAQRDGPLLHLLDHHPIRRIRPGKRVDLRAAGTFDHHRIHVPATNRLQGLPRFAKLLPQFLDFRFELPNRLYVGLHGHPFPITRALLRFRPQIETQKDSLLVG